MVYSDLDIVKIVEREFDNIVRLVNDRRYNAAANACDGLSITIRQMKNKVTDYFTVSVVPSESFGVGGASDLLRSILDYYNLDGEVLVGDYDVFTGVYVPADESEVIMNDIADTLDGYEMDGLLESSAIYSEGDLSD